MVKIEADGEREFLVKMSGVVLSYPHLFEPFKARNPKPGEKAKYGAKFLMDRRDKEQNTDAQTVYKKIVEMAKVNFKQSLPADKYCLRDGRQLTEDLHNYFVISANEELRPTVVDRRRQPVTAEDELFYPGCIVNATIRLWVQDSKDWGKRINANLVGVQFMAHGTRLGGRAKPKADEMFDDVSDKFDDDEYQGEPTGDGGRDPGDSDSDGLTF